MSGKKKQGSAKRQDFIVLIVFLGIVVLILAAIIIAQLRGGFGGGGGGGNSGRNRDLPGSGSSVSESRQNSESKEVSDEYAFLDEIFDEVYEEGAVSGDGPERPESTADLEMPREEAEVLVADMAKAAQEYLHNMQGTVEYVSRNGYLQINSMLEYVTPEHIEDYGESEAEYSETSVLILYLRAGDMEEWIPDPKADPDEFKIYAAYEVEEGFMVSDASGNTALIPADILRELLSDYENDSGNDY